MPDKSAGPDKPDQHGQTQDPIARPPALVAPGAEHHNVLTLSSWIEIELVGEDDKPIPGEAYRITLSNGQVIEGKLDDNGLAAVRNISRGASHVEFPNLDQDAWDLASKAKSGSSHPA